MAQCFWLVRFMVLPYTLSKRRDNPGGIPSLTIQSPAASPNARGPVRRLFVKVFLWFWLTVLALFPIFFASRTLGSRLLPSTDVIAAFAPWVAEEAAHAYESGGPKNLSNSN